MILVLLRGLETVGNCWKLSINDAGFVAWPRNVGIPGVFNTKTFVYKNNRFKPVPEVHIHPPIPSLLLVVKDPTVLQTVSHIQEYLQT
jgi:hypothetical protein